MPLQQDTRIKLANFLIRKGKPADANPKDWYTLLGWLVLSLHEGKTEREIRSADVFFAKSKLRMIRRGWTSDAELALVANGWEFFLDP